MKTKSLILSDSTIMVSMTFSVELKKKSNLRIRVVERPFRWGAGFIHESSVLDKYLSQIKLC